MTSHPTARTVPVGHDLACGLLAGVLEAGNVFVTPDVITFVAVGSQVAKPETNWLRLDDILGQLSAECFQARQKMVDTPPVRKVMPWERAKELREREAAIATYRQKRQRVFDLLKTRGALAEAERRGFRVVTDG